MAAELTSFEAALIWLGGGKQKMMNTCNTQSLAIHALASSFLVSSDELGAPAFVQLYLLHYSYGQQDALIQCHGKAPCVAVSVPPGAVTLQILPVPFKRANHNCDTSKRFASGT